MIDRIIDGWEVEHSATTIENSIAPLVRVLDEAVRDNIISINPAKHRARRNPGKHVPHTTGALRQHALPDLATLPKLADACGEVHHSYSDHVMLAALLAARGCGVAGLRGGRRGLGQPDCVDQEPALSRPRRPLHQVDQRPARPPRAYARRPRVRQVDQGVTTPGNDEAPADRQIYQGFQPSG